MVCGDGQAIHSQTIIALWVRRLESDAHGMNRKPGQNISDISLQKNLIRLNVFPGVPEMRLYINFPKEEGIGLIVMNPNSLLLLT